MRNYFHSLTLMAAVGIAGAGLMVADTFDKKTTITTDETMQLPNATLQAGTYVVKLVDSGSNRHIVQFFDKDEKHLVTTILAIPNERLHPTGKSVFAFWEVPAGQPKALRAWFYPGDTFGQEFAYPKNEADRISANNQNAKVPINEEKMDMSAATDTSKTSTVVAEPAPAPAPVVTAEATTPPPAPVVAAPAPQAAPAPVVTTPARLDTNSDAQMLAQNNAPPATTTLPKTASNVPLIGLLGLLSLGGALALKLAYR